MKSTFNRMRELMNESHSPTNNINVVHTNSAVNNEFGVIRENNSSYVIKRKNGDTYELLEGLANKAKHTFSSYKKACSYLDLMCKQLTEDNKYVMNVDSPTSPSPAAPTKEPSLDLDSDIGGGDEFTDDIDLDFGDEDLDLGSDEDVSSDFDDGESGDSEDDNVLDPKKSIQKKTGKLTYELREYMEDDKVDLQTATAKSVLSAISWDTISEKETQELIDYIESKFEETQEPDDISPEDQESVNDTAIEDEGDIDLDFEEDELNLEGIDLTELDDIIEKMVEKETDKKEKEDKLLLDDE